MIPFVLNPITEATSPLKLFEYFAGGRPVISAAMPECAAFEEVLIARTPEEFSAALDQAAVRSGDALFQERLRSIARRNSWQLRVKTITRELRRVRRGAAVDATLPAMDAR